MGSALIEVEEERDHDEEEDEGNGGEGKRPVQKRLLTSQLLAQSSHLAHQLLEGLLGGIETLAQILHHGAGLLGLLLGTDAHSLQDLELFDSAPFIAIPIVELTS